MRKLAAKVSGFALMIALGALLGASPASAAPGVGIAELSDDGVSFSRTYPGVIFNDIARLSPGDSQSKTIYVRNTGTVAGYLRITMREVRYSDSHYGDALSVRTGTTGSSGSAISVSTANPCMVTHEGTIIAPGQVVPIVATLALGNLSGSDGQGATASLALRFSLTDSRPGSLPATNCGNAGTTVPVTPTGPGSPGSNDSTGILSSGISVPNPSPSPAVAAPEESTNNGLLPALPATFSLDPNTWRLYQEYLVLILLLAASIGAGISWLVGRRSRRDSEDV
ncbi:hypothetical protein A20C1_07643 [marine actinobacterium PHSC20C1]|nr:hypothetical protein A20C1_07643 [marine actinobacterium PHSC20C1]